MLEVVTIGVQNSVRACSYSYEMGIFKVREKKVQQCV